ncbi:MAG TPA: type II toxin-antitoxin system VapC family toxin [Coriobacteriia bacterium]
MKTVLDASIAVALVIDESGSEAATLATAGCEFIVPDTFWGEVTNALLRKVRTGMTDRAGALAAYALLRRSVTRTIPTERLAPVAMALSLDLPHPVYDCFYLATAITHGAPLLTADRALHAAAVDAGYAAAVRLVG